MRADIAFFSSKALSTDGVIWDCDREEVCLRQTMLQNADKRVFLCASEKFGQHSGYRQCSLHDVDCMITEAEENETFALLGELAEKII